MASGLVLLFVLNLLRMTLIAGLWIVSGPTAALSTIHLFAGILLFYLAIIVMMLVAGKFGLGLKPATKKKPARVQYSTLGIALAFAFAVVYLLLTLI